MAARARVLQAVLLLVVAVVSVLPSRPVLADEVEEVEDVDAVAAPPVAPCPPDTGPLGVFGKLHPAMVHLPIAWVFLVFLLDVLTFLVGKAEYARFGLVTLGLAVASAIPAMASGLVRGEVLETQASMEPLIEAHETTMFVMVGVLSLAFVVRVLRRDHLVGWSRWVYLGLMAAAVGLVGYGGHLGGRIVFGPDHLPF